ncbi:energy-coupling factor transport system substrate-specific component [Virgibacillus natechei]|uniref:Energy-coupling factor transport system substrate-specific component n=1 Tax=Virgibacillus natechei TaxID=1216297 RepID=A0ABS4II26_9BACI|nr:ECF transporter S component [Virgibacillus natechei]MBP1969639.1 energy-coupling factor transport system substrate-specific component [Virgibacillus natechei]UZD11367.1 ECF transporter S component [Virgibacillus natechei]
MNTYKLTLLALLAALAVVGRSVFAFLPSVQPVTSIIIICGLFLGPMAAILLAFLTTFLSNMLLGMGVWTIWQVVSWAIIGLLSGLIGKIPIKLPIWTIVIYAIFSGYLYGFIVSVTTYQITGHFWPYYIAGLPFDTNHAIGNAVFIILLFPIISYYFKKYADNRFVIQNTN